MYFGWITKTLFGSTLLIGVIFLGGWIWLMQVDAHDTRVVFLDVGQGDAILIQSGKQQILIDGGRNGQVLLNALGRVVPFYDRTIDVVIATHPDADHIGGLSALLDRYQVGQFVETGAVSNTQDFVLLMKTLMEHEVPRDIPGKGGVSFELGQGGKLSILYPEVLPLPNEFESNEGSIVARFDFGATSFLFTGDLPNEEVVLPGIRPATVLKAAHHGSRFSTSDRWLDLVQPKEGVLSVGENTYGHPAPAVLHRLTERNITTMRTDVSGSITYRCFHEEERCRRDE